MTDRASLGRWLSRPVDVASLALFRIIFGLTLAVGLVRFMIEGWIHTVYVEPTFFFKYWGFEWVVVWPEWALYALFLGLVVCAICIAIGLLYRAATISFFIGFTYVQLMDVTNYLNHYYLVVLIAGLLTVLPLHRALSVDVLRGAARPASSFPAWMLYLLRFQIGVVYVSAALAKAGPDWLLYGQPLNIWLSARTETLIIGPWLGEPWVALAMSWAGFLYDATIVGFLSWRRTRLFAYAAVLAFHGLTQVFFDIGMFPLIMVGATLVFFSPSWPRRVFRRWIPVDAASDARNRSVGWALGSALALYCVLQVALPLRSHLYPGDVHWHEQGMRYAWRVMVREKNASVTYHVRQGTTGRTWQVSPHAYLTWRQANEMAAQPDLVLQLARFIAGDFERKGLGRVEVRAEVWASLNGRPPSLLIDPEVNLAALEDGVARAAWILPPPGSEPARLSPRQLAEPGEPSVSQPALPLRQIAARGEPPMSQPALPPRQLAARGAP